MQGLEKLKDIKPPIEVNDTSFIIFTIILFLLSIIAGVLIYFLIKKYFKKKRRKKKSKKEIALENLKNINFKNTKEAVYSFSENAYILVQPDKEKMKKLQNILKDIEKYKYKKEISSLSKEDIKKMKDFIKAVK